MSTPQQKPRGESERQVRANREKARRDAFRAANPLPPKPSNAERFWSKVDKENGPIHPIYGRCWVWSAGRFDSGYGAFNINSSAKKLVRAHRFAREISSGLVPYGLLVLHKCDNPPCVRPEHLFVGTWADNMRDKVAKGRESHVRANNKLTEDQVRQIRIRIGNEIDAGIASDFGVSVTTIRLIRIGATWRSVP